MTLSWSPAAASVWAGEVRADRRSDHDQRARSRSTCSSATRTWSRMDDAGTLIPDGAVAITGPAHQPRGPDAEVAAAVCRGARRSTPRARRSIRGWWRPTCTRRTRRSAASSPTRSGRWTSSRPSRRQFYDVVTDEEEELGCAARLPGDGAQRHDLLPGGGHRSCPRAAACRGADAWASGRSWATSASSTSRAASRRARRPRPQAGPSSSRARPRTSTRRSRGPGCAAAAQRGPRRARARPHRDPGPRDRQSETLLLRGQAPGATRRASCSTCTTRTAVADTEADRVRYGKDPLLHLAEIGVLDRNTTLGHANHLTDAETRGAHRDAARASPGRRPRR